MLALAHRTGTSLDPELVPDRHHEPLDLGVVVRQSAAKRRSARRFSAWKPEVVSVSRSCAIQETTRASTRIPMRRAADDCSRRPRGTASRSRGRPRRPRPGRPPRGAGRVVLPVAVQPDGERVAAFPGEAEPSLHSAADAEVERKLHHVRAGRSRDLCGAVGRAVGDDDDLEARSSSAAPRAGAACSAPRCRPG